jgi:hypothetical protein
MMSDVDGAGEHVAVVALIIAAGPKSFVTWGAYRLGRPDRFHFNA